MKCFLFQNKWHLKGSKMKYLTNLINTIPLFENDSFDSQRYQIID